MDSGVQQIQIILKDYKKADHIAERIKTLLSSHYEDIEVEAWTEIGEYPAVIRIMEEIYFVIFIVVAFLGAFIISNIMMMVVLERRKEMAF